jgi:hypothetical protein
MKKYLLLVCCLANMACVLAQDQFGLKISPGFSYNRIHTDPDTASFESDGLGFSLKLGPMYDYQIKDNYYLNTGLFFAIKRFSIKNNRLNLQESHDLQYLQVPLLLKLYTSEIALDTRVYVELGPLVGLKINGRVSKLASDKPFIKKFKTWKIDGLLGAGIEYNISLFTSIFAGISYQLGLSSIIGGQEATPPAPSVFGYHDSITIDIGLKF